MITHIDKSCDMELPHPPKLPIMPVTSKQPPNTNCFNAHFHERVELLVVTEGEVFFEIMGKTYRATAGDIAVMNPYCPHAGYTKDQGVKYHVVMLHVHDGLNGNRFAQNDLQPLIERQIAFKPLIRDSYIYKAVDQLANSEKQNFMGFNLTLLSTAYGILARLFKEHIDTEYQKVATNSKFKVVIEYINERYNKPINTAAICKEFGYSESYLCRKFKQVTGLSPMVYIRLLRLESSKSLLRETTADIASIAVACGFSDTGYFQKSFKEVYGITPVKYRKREEN